MCQSSAPGPAALRAERTAETSAVVRGRAKHQGGALRVGRPGTEDEGGVERGGGEVEDGREVGGEEGVALVFSGVC